jgi:hypothetical protein
MNKYNNAKVYKIVNDIDDKIYIGSTYQSLTKRFRDHKADAKRRPKRRVYKHFNAIGWNNVKIILIEEFPCKSKIELEKREREMIDELLPSLNKRIPCRTLEEYYQCNKVVIKAKYELNKEVILAKQRKYQNDNREQFKEYQKEYRLTNKDKINANRRAQYAARQLRKQQEADSE